MGCCSSSQAAADPLGKKQAASDRATQLPAGLSFHLPTTGPLSPQDFRQRLVCSPGTQVVYLPNSGYTVKYAYVSFRGYYPEALYKAGQDTACAVSNFGDDPEQIFLGVFDGHGTAGTECSQFAREQVPAAMQKDLLFKSYPEKSFHNAMVHANHELHEAPIDDMQSGTTAVNILIRGTALYVANVGDSRAVLAEWQNSKLTAVNLTVDQTAFRRDECERVKVFGARVLTLDQVYGVKDPSIECWGTEEEDGGDPPRLWAQNGNYPGTAFTRSIGDNAAEAIGVCAEPELAIKQLTSAHPFFVLGSDGIFEFMPSQTVIDMVSKYDDPQEAAIAVVVEAYRLWLQYEVRTDDITIIVACIDGLKDPLPGAEKKSMRLQTLESLQSMRRMTPIKQSPARSPSPSVYGNGKNAAGIQASSYSQLQEASIQVELQQPRQQQQPKSPEDLQNIVTAVKGVSALDSLTTLQWQTVLLAMEKQHFSAGEVVIQKGEEAAFFYVVSEGQFGVALTSGGRETIIHTYSAGDHANSSFGELALASGRPHAAKVVAKTDGVLFQLDANTFRSVVTSSRANSKALIKTLRSISLLQALSVGQLEQLAQIMVPESYDDGAYLVRQGEPGSYLFVVETGEVICTHRYTGDLGEPQEIMSFGPGQYFGENALLDNYSYNASAVARGRVSVLRASKADFNTALGPLPELIQADQMWQQRSDHHGHAHPGSPGSKRTKLSINSSRNAACLETLADASKACGPDDLQIQQTLYNTGMTALVQLTVKDQGYCYTARVWSLAKVSAAQMQQQVWQLHGIAASLSHSEFVPACLKTHYDDRLLCEILDTDAVCSLSDLMFPQPLNEPSVVHVAACIVAAFDQMHSHSILFRGLEPSTIAIDTNGLAQLVDFRFVKQLTSREGRAYSICGNAAYVAPEVSGGKGYSYAADYWSLGVLIFFLLHGQLPSQNGQLGDAAALQVSPTLSSAAVDLLKQLWHPDPLLRLGKDPKDVIQIKAHSFFKDIDWIAGAAQDITPPHAFTHRIAHYNGPAAKPFVTEALAGDMSWLQDF